MQMLVYMRIYPQNLAAARAHTCEGGGGVADICLCIVWPCAVTLPRAGLNFWRATFNFCSLG